MVRLQSYPVDAAGPYDTIEHATAESVEFEVDLVAVIGRQAVITRPTQAGTIPSASSSARMSSNETCRCPDHRISS
ncbi:hypothetical protein ACIG56_27290 [Nocardia fusca]|uniref:hypothetical protein n=1 Tax=Nocardia fusca TaxID=941183 RepID=UPI0037C52DBF